MSNESHIVNRIPELGTDEQINKPEILIIDDETDICHLLSNFLKQKDIRTVFASSLSEAISIIEQGEKLSLIFLDNHLPDGRGVDFIKQIKRALPDCKVIMITAHDNQADREKADKAGADYFIGKPFSRELILTIIDRLSA